MNVNEDITYQNLWDVAKVMLKKTCMAVNLNIRRKRNVLNQSSEFLPQDNSKRKAK